ncbi:MAG: oxidoreductase [Pseudomonadota bacterium]
MSDQHLHRVHDGERYVQTKRGSPEHFPEQLPFYIAEDMPRQHSDFYQRLPYIGLGTLDHAGRPWASLLVTRSGLDDGAGIQLTAPNILDVASVTSEHDPFVRALEQHKEVTPDAEMLFAGVGVDFTNRRRNKLAGVIQSFDVAKPGLLRLRLSSNQHLGNCPKYITVRTLVPASRTPKLGFDRYEGLDEPLSTECKAIISQASTVFLATKHIPETEVEHVEARDMGFNHRGGAPGFIRAYEEQVTTNEHNRHLTHTYLVLPDHSGNRFYQSLGNIQSDRVVGVTFPNFLTGDVLYITGEAENLFDQEAEALMPRVDLLTRIRITGAVLIKQALSLRLESEEEYSPYNPPIRRLRSEMSGELDLDHAPERVMATLTSRVRHSNDLTTFKFRLSKPIRAFLPGGFGIFDFSSVFDRVYKHMDEENPQAVNDDHIRTWTLSNASKFDAIEKRFIERSNVEITVKRKPDGLVSNYLHELDSSYTSADTGNSLSVPFLGSGGDFTCFSQAPPNSAPVVPKKMLWIAGGAGITPFMSMWDGLMAMREACVETEELSADIVLYYAGRNDDVNVVQHFLAGGDHRGIHLEVFCFQSLTAGVQPADDIFAAPVQRGRLSEDDFKTIHDLLDREVFVCGPVSFMQDVGRVLKALAGEGLVIHQESYAF